ncbi:MAG TPA: NAD(P)H-quinone oxidoreductase [Mycobacteriales bacterium]|nr:NAD(P)H-quinone oxidoreductase [Mycobacteriales bacterium]
MYAVRCEGSGDVDVLRWAELPDPEPADGEVLIEVVASAVNRADLSQRMGFYPPPPGITDVLGLECSGRVIELGPGVIGWAVGDEVCALVAGGGQAELAVAPAGQCMPVPAGVDLTTAGGLPEVACTVWSNLVLVAELRAGDVLLVHGGSSGIGTLAIQVGKALGATVIATAGNPDKLAHCARLGADRVVNYRDEDFTEAVREETDGYGADVVLDIIGADYLERNVSVLATGGRLVCIGMQGGTRAELDIGALLRKRASVHATSLRSRPLAEKAAICRAVVEGLWPLIEAGQVIPVVETSYPMNRVADAHTLVAQSGHVGKVLLTRP